MGGTGNAGSGIDRSDFSTTQQSATPPEQQGGAVALRAQQPETCPTDFFSPA